MRIALLNLMRHKIVSETQIARLLGAGPMQVELTLFVPDGYVPKTTPISPQDLMATMLHVLGVPRDLQFVNRSGRPVTMIGSGQPIKELV